MNLNFASKEEEKSNIFENNFECSPRKTSKSRLKKLMTPKSNNLLKNMRLSPRKLKGRISQANHAKSQNMLNMNSPGESKANFAEVSLRVQDNTTSSKRGESFGRGNILRTTLVPFK